jgi:uncharacterized repeat protein (TIGR02543 family)
MKNVLKKLAVCMIAMAMLVMVRAVFAPDVSAKASDTSGTYTLELVDSLHGTDTKLTCIAGSSPFIASPSEDGYTFNGWNTASDGNGGTSYKGIYSGTNTDKSEIILYAQWTKNMFYLVLDGNGSTSGSYTNWFYAYTGNCKIPANVYARTGYTFAGWNTKADGSGQSFEDEEVFYCAPKTNGGTLTFYAQWTPITYNVYVSRETEVNGKTATLKTFFACTYDQQINLDEYITSRTGYTFAGWNTAQNGSGTAYNGTVSGLSSKDGDTVWLYAQWTKDTSAEETSYSISYVLNGGTNNSANPSSYTGSSAVRLKDPTRTGYTFDGWYKDSAFKTQISTIAKGSTGNLTLYAKWTKDTSGESSGSSQSSSSSESSNSSQESSSNQESDSSKKQTVYTIVFDGNGSSSGSMADMEKCSYGSEYSLTANKFKKTGYTFAGWNTKADGSGTSYKNKASVKNLTSKSNGTVTLYAQWTLNKYTITFDGNGSTSGSMSDLTDCKYTASYKLTANKFKKTGCTFAGWNTKKDGSGTSYKNKASVKKLTSKNKGTVTLYAQWTPNRYTITFDGNGSTSGSMSDLTDCKYTASYKLTANKFKKTGYTFAGWNTKKDGSGKTYKNKASVKKLTSKNGGTVTLYAQWTAAAYSIKYVLNGGTNSDSNPSSYTYGNAVTLKAPTRSGYTFLGWYTDKNLTKSIKKISAKASGKLTLYAGWKKTKTTCTTCGGSGTVPCGTCGGSKTTETKCDTCHGLGYNTISGQGAEVCGTCDGAGTISTECTTCNGKGEVTCSNCGGTGTK